MQFISPKIGTQQNWETARTSTLHSQRKSNTKISKCQSKLWFKFILMKTKHPVHIMVFGLVNGDGDDMPPFIFSQGLKLDKETYIRCLEAFVLPGSRGWLFEDSMSTNWILHDATQAEASREKISATISPLTSARLTLRNPIPLITICGTEWSKRQTKSRATPKMNWRQG